METNKELYGMLDLLVRPGFCVNDHIITYTNQAAQSLLLQPGTDVRDLLLTGQEDYDAVTEGCLYLQLNIADGCGASVLSLDGQQVFLLDQESDDDALRAMALAAQKLRGPLAGIQAALDQLSADSDQNKEAIARLNRSMHQMLRMIGNMSDAGRTTQSAALELRDVSKIFDEIFEKAAHFVSQAGMTLEYHKEVNHVQSLADAALLERAVWNILSNTLKFCDKGSTLWVQLSRREKMLRLSIADNGSGIAQNLRQTLFRQYLRQPGIEDSRFGLGLGMVLIRSAAAQHGGTVLIDQPEGVGSRITITLPIRQDTSGMLRSPVLRVDYAGEQEHALVELSDCLPLRAYYKE